MVVVLRGRVFTLMAEYVLLRGGLYYYQRRIPKDVARHYRRGQQTKIVRIFNRGGLMREQGVPSLSVHDSLVVRREDAELARTYLEEEYESRAGANRSLLKRVT